jgi:CMP-N,N'-diacetyllegionaminic acid synthase
MNMVALIPARAGSKRIPGKNTKLLAGRPLLAWTIQAALESGVFWDVIVSTDSQETIKFAVECGAKFSVRMPQHATDESPDIEWVRWTLAQYPDHYNPDAFAILRPTSPFRTAETIRRAYDRFQTQEVHSMRAVQPVKEHPGKMWQCAGAGYPMKPLIGKDWPPQAKGEVPYPGREDRPWHSVPTQTLPRVFVQNASLEMAWSWVVPAFGTISGNKVAPFFTEGYEGFDLNTMDDWREAERLIKEGLVVLPSSPLASL